MGIVNDLLKAREKVDIDQVLLNEDIANCGHDFEKSSKFIGGKSLRYRQTIIDRRRAEIQRKLQALANRGEPWRLRLKQKQDEVATLEVEIAELEQLKQIAYSALVAGVGDVAQKAVDFKNFSDMLTKKRKLLQYAQNSLFQHRVRKPIGVYETLPEELQQMAERKEASEQCNAPQPMSDLAQLAREFMNDPKKLKEYAQHDLNTKVDIGMPIDAGEFELNIKEETDAPASESTNPKENSD